MTFERVGNTLFTMVEEGFEDRFAEVADRLEKHVQAVQKDFFDIMAIKAIDVSGPPDLGSYTPTWKALTTKYLAAKGKAGFSTNFYKRTGALQTSLQKLNPLTVLGKPVVRFKPSSGSGVSGRYERWQGAGSRRFVVRDSRGRFTSTPKNIKAIIGVNPYSKLPDVDEVDEIKVLGKEIGSKLKNPGGKRQRPILRNYLNWWLETKIAEAMAKALT